jgi:signal transduction histidine kinase
MLLTNLQPSFVPKIICGGLIMLHPLLMFEGIISFHGMRRRWWGTPLNSGLVILGLPCFAYFLFISENLAIRSASILLILALIFARICFEPLLYANCRRYSMQWLLSISLLPLTTLLVLRSWVVLTGPIPATFSGMLQSDNLLDACMNDAAMARGELHLVLAYFDLTALLNNVRQHFSDVCPERAVALTTPSAPQMYHGDERLLFHLAVNLVDNALKFSALPVSI